MKAKDWQQGRNDGLLLAQRIIKEGGEKQLTQEIRARGLDGSREKVLNINLTNKELTEELTDIKELTIRTILAMTVATLRDEYGFGKDRLQRFIGRFMEKTNCLDDGWITWEDLCKTIEEETGITIEYGDMWDRSKEETT